MRRGVGVGAWSGAVLGLGLGLILLGAAAPGPTADREAEARRADQAALGRFGGLVGDWRGAGQVRRGSTQGAWTEAGAWAWRLEPGSARLELQVTRGKFLRSATLIPPAKPDGPLMLEAVFPDGMRRSFRERPGTTDPSQPTVFEAEGPGDGVRRITLTTPNENRFLLLYEGGAAGANVGRLGEVGSTRVGAAFAAGEAGPKCIVTGGRGTMTVSYQGKTYPVCCSGCRDLFNQDPAAVLAEAAARQP